MGRPLNKRYFGTASVNAINIKFHNGTEVVDGHIISQRSSNKFLCSDGTIQRECKLVAQPDMQLQENQMSIAAMIEGQPILYITKISSRIVTASDGYTYPWVISNGNLQVVQGDMIEMYEFTDFEVNE